MTIDGFIGRWIRFLLYSQNMFCKKAFRSGVKITRVWARVWFLCLLCGITVNASIYILNEYNSIRKRYPCLSPLRAYVKAWNTKVIPIFLTVVSTILGFIPFMIGAEKEGFWFPLAAGTIRRLLPDVSARICFID